MNANCTSYGKLVDTPFTILARLAPLRLQEQLVPALSANRTTLSSIEGQ